MGTGMSKVRKFKIIYYLFLKSLKNKKKERKENHFGENLFIIW